MAKRVISAILTLKDQNFSSGLKKAATNTDDFNRIVLRARNQIDGFASSALRSFKKVSLAAGTLATTGISAVATALATTASEMDSAFSKLEASTGVSGAELEGLEEIAKNVYKNGFGETLPQVVNDLGILKQTLGTVDNKTLESTQILSALSENMDVDSVARALRSMTSSFPGATQQKSLDLITKTLQVGGDASGDLLDTFNEYSGVVASAGIGMDSFANIMVNGAKAGARNYDVVADTLKEFNILTKTGSDDTKAAFKTLGLDANKVASDLAAGGERGEKAYYKTMQALSKLDDESKYSVGVALMGTKFEDLEAKTIEAMGTGIDLLGNFEGATAKAGAALQDNFGTRMNKVWREIKVGAVDAFRDAGGGEVLDKIAIKAEELVPKINDMVTAGVGFAKAIQDNWGTIVKVITPIGSAIGAVYLTLGAVGVWNAAVGAMNMYKASAFATTVAQHGFNAALKANPIGVVITVIGLLVAAGVALYQNWDTVKTKGTELWGMIRSNPITAFLTQPIQNAINMGVFLYQNWDTIRAKGGELYTKVKEVFGGIYDWGQTKIQPVVSFFQGLSDKVDRFKGSLSNFKLPDWVSKVGSVVGGGVFKGVFDGSHANGLNYVPYDGYVAELHKGEMVIPARQSERLRQSGANIGNVDRVATTSNVTTNNSNSSNNINITINAQGTTAREVLNEVVPQLKLVLANM
ncbi:phage-related minor tail protein [Lysinibacillus composti]|uniref:Phage tail tape measure protein domain-containing protein n=1 Tax=Lysinibacillus composti TaxID=720633 RepID=A0A3N9UKU4_9BACI|nr:phage tail tape measure protein [Lysinibacillus composti]MBM7607577.1 phage-related minor tail protein [Lysinibacillus composti]RQW75918.1 hypothetical protein EBB45_04690 [Lysinibacillus composti]